MHTLYDLPLNRSGIINEINAADAVKERLHSFGLIKGVAITPVKNSPLGCPRIYRCLDTIIAVRNRTAKRPNIKII
jgi:Fe2+ transport system protein FeoA